MNELESRKHIQWRLAASFLAVSIVMWTNGCCKKDNPVEHEEQTAPGKHLVLIQNYSDTMWIGTHSDSLGEVMRTKVGDRNEYWIGGRVVPDEDYPWGFYFDPNTIVIAEMTVEGMQTTIRQIAEDTDYFANNGWSNGLTEHAWFVLGSFSEYRLNE